MDERKPSLKARAEVLRLRQAKARAERIARSSTPWGTVGPRPDVRPAVAQVLADSLAGKREGYLPGWTVQVDGVTVPRIRPGAPKVGKPLPRPSHRVQYQTRLVAAETLPNGRTLRFKRVTAKDEHGPLNVPGAFTRYGTHYGTRRNRAGNIVTRVRKDAWARDRSRLVGLERLTRLRMSASRLEPHGTPRGIGNGIGQDAPGHDAMRPTFSGGGKVWADGERTKVRWDYVNVPAVPEWVRFGHGLVLEFNRVTGKVRRVGGKASDLSL